jgi:hypothetical protein
MLARLQARPQRLAWLIGLLLVLIWLLVYLTTVSPGVNFIDSGELITAVHEPGIAHPPGYPLYVLMGYVASHVLWGDVAWRVNVFSAFWGAMAVGAFFFLIYQAGEYVSNLKPRKTTTQTKSGTRSAKASTRAESVPKDRAVASVAQTTQPGGLSAASRNLLLLASSAAGASILAASSTFWSRTAQAKMYTLHYFFIAVLLTLALQYRAAYERGDKTASTRWLLALAITLGLSFTNHLMTVLLLLPIALLLVGGTNMGDRFRNILRRWPLLLPAFLAPLLLYLYMPIRAAQGPTMNWGTPDTLGDFWRQITGWQYQTYLGANLSQNMPLLSRYAFEQWSLLTVPVYVAGIAGAALLFKVARMLFWPTLVLAVLTMLFAILYGISEIEPYMFGVYAIFAIWIGLAPICWINLSPTRQRTAARVPGTQRTAASETSLSETHQQSWAMVALAAVIVLGSAIMIYPRQNYSRNRLAEQFVLNVFNELPQNSILITDYWDFYAPTYYMQIEQGIRPDLALVNTNSLKYPWYVEQLTKRYPWLMQKSQDILATYKPEQRKFVNGESFDVNTLDQSYYALLTSFVERNAPDHPAYILPISLCPPNSPQCENSRIAPTYDRQPVGLVYKFVAPNSGDQPVPPEASFATEGVTGQQVPLDDAARANSKFYADAYSRMASYYNFLNQPQSAQNMADKAQLIRSALAGR